MTEEQNLFLISDKILKKSITLSRILKSQDNINFQRQMKVHLSKNFNLIVKQTGPPCHFFLNYLIVLVHQGNDFSA